MPLRWFFVDHFVPGSRSWIDLSRFERDLIKQQFLTLPESELSVRWWYLA